MAGSTSKRYTEMEVEQIIRRALKGRDVNETLSHDELLETALELGIDPAQVEAAALAQDVDEDLEEAREIWLRRRKQRFTQHLRAYIIVNAALFLMNLFTPGPWWFFWPVIGCGIGLAFDWSDAHHPDEAKVERGARRIAKARRRREIQAV